MNHKLLSRALALALALLLALSGSALAEQAESEAGQIQGGKVRPAKTLPVGIGAPVGAKNAATARANDVEPTEIAITTQAPATIHLGYKGELEYALTPADATTTLTWSSSNKKVAKVDAATGVITPVKAGKAKITVKTANGLKATIQLVVKKNKATGLNPKPTKTSLKEAGERSLVWPKSVEILKNGKLVAEFYIIANFRKVVKLTNFKLNVSLSTTDGDMSIASHTFSTVKINASKNKVKTFKVTVPAGDVQKFEGVPFPLYALNPASVDVGGTFTIWYIK